MYQSVVASEGITIPQDASELRVTPFSRVPKTVVYPTLWVTCRHHIWDEGTNGCHMSGGGGDATSDLHVPLVIASTAKLKLAGPAVKVGMDTYLVIDVHYLMTEGLEVCLTAIPYRWLSLSVRKPESK